jgi:hypothetical protein
MCQRFSIELYKIPVRICEKQREYSKWNINTVVPGKVYWLKLVSNKSYTKEHPVSEWSLEWANSLSCRNLVANAEAPEDVESSPGKSKVPLIRGHVEMVCIGNECVGKEEQKTEETQKNNLKLVDVMWMQSLV